MKSTMSNLNAVVADGLIHIGVEFILTGRRIKIRQADDLVPVLNAFHQIKAAVLSSRNQTDDLHFRR